MKKCIVCENELSNDGELIIKSFAGGTDHYVHTRCHYQHLLNYSVDEYLEFEDYEREITIYDVLSSTDDDVI